MGDVNSIAVISGDSQISVFNSKSEKKENSDVKITGCGGNGFLVKCDLLNLQGNYQIKSEMFSEFANFGRSLAWVHRLVQE